MSDLILDEVEKTLNTLHKWQWPVFIGTTKYLQNTYNCFWTAQAVRDINDEYNRLLRLYNGNQIKQISWFKKRPKPDPEVIPSTMVDVRSWPDLILFAVRKVEYNKNHLLKICEMFRDNFYENMNLFGEAAETYLKGQNLDAVPFDTNTYKFGPRKKEKDLNDSYNLIKNWAWETQHKVVMPKDKDELDKYIVSGPIFSNLSFKINEVTNKPISDGTLEKLENQNFDGLKFEQTIEAIEHYKMFVSLKDQDKFLKEFKKVENQKFTLFEEIANEIFIKIIKKYFSYGKLFSTNEQFEEIERNRTLSEFETEFNSFVYRDFKEMCTFVDVLSIFYKKGFCFLTTTGYLEMNSIMRRYYVDSTYSWLCFDPYWTKEWEVILNYKDLPDTLLMGWIIFKNISVRSSLILKALEIAKATQDPKEQEQRVKKSIKDYKKEIRNHKIFFWGNTMLTYEDLYNLLKQADENKKNKQRKKRQLVGADENNDEIELNDFKPEPFFGAVPPKLNIVEETRPAVKAKQIKFFKQVLEFIEVNKYRRLSVGCTIMPIPVLAREYLKIWGTRQSVTNNIEKMIDLGLIEFHKPYDYKNGIAKTFKYFVDNEKKFKEYCEKNNIRIDIENIGDQTKLDPVEKMLMPFKVEDVRFHYDLRLVKPENKSKADFLNDWIIPSLYEHYPWLGFWKKKIEEINESYKDYPELRLTLEPTFTWTKTKYEKTGKTVEYIRKIGIRVANKMVGLQTRNSDERERYRKLYGFNLEKDVKSSVPRLTKSLHRQEWVDESIDIYELINNELKPFVPFTKDRRDVIKDIHMRVYFNDKSPKDIRAHLFSYCQKNGVSTKGIDKKEADDLIEKYWNAMVKVEEGKPFGSEIFFIESIVYLMTVYDLVKAGHIVYFVFDCFYSTGQEGEVSYEQLVADDVRLNFEDFLRSLGINRIEKKSGYKVSDVLEKYSNRVGVK